MTSRGLRKLPLILPALALCGCVSIPPVSDSRGSLQDELKAHVAYLCQPELKGRKTRTQGARAAAKYIAAAYRAHGLVPWGKEKGYEQSFGYGRNVIGVLPGADPVLKEEIVLVCAHYDHLGKNGNKVHPGASDNAAGVAALLETIRLTATTVPRTRRSVAFAAFDAEEQMLLGSFAFSLRKDVENAKVVAVVNADILGREFMDVVTNTLFVAGTEAYPSLRDDVKQTGAVAGIRILPLGTDLIGPRSDHVAFESRGVPCLFFTCGTCKDYHQPTDSPDKLRYADLESSTRTMAATVKRLATATPLPARIRAADENTLGFFREELQTVSTIMSEVNANRERAGVKKEDAEAFARLEKQAQALLEGGNYDAESRTKLISEATGILAPYFLAFDSEANAARPDQRKDLALGLRCVQLFYVLHKEEVLKGYRALVARVLKDRPGPFRSMRRTDYRLYLLDDAHIRVAERPDGTYSLDAIANWLNLTAGSSRTKWLLKGFGVSMALGFDAIHCQGTREELEDFCLLRLRNQRTDSATQAQTHKLLAAIKAPSAGKTWVQAIADRLSRGQFPDETAWLAHCILSGNPKLALQALSAGERHPGVISAACRVITNREIRGDIRAAAINAAVKQIDPSVVFTLCEVADDATPTASGEPNPLLNDEYPFADRAWVQAIRPLFLRHPTTDPKSPATVGMLARSHLKTLAKRDYGADPARWRAWAESASAQIARMASSSP